MQTLSQRLAGLQRGDASPPLVLAIVCAGVVLASLDLFIVNVALPEMAKDLNASGLDDLSWVLNAYAIVYAALLVLFGRISDGRSRRNGFLLGLAIFVAASAACALSTSVEMLVAFRVVQAVGAALMTPTSLSLVLATAPPEKRQSSVRAWAAVGGAAAALGPVLGGLLVGLSWHWVFIVNVPIGLLALAVAWVRLPDIPGEPVPRPDALGAVLVTGGVGLLTLGLVKGDSWGWGSTETVAVLAAATAAIGLFVVDTLRARNPLIDPALFRIRTFTGASIAMTLFSIAFGAMLLSVVLWMQDVWGWSALQSGLALAPGPAMVPIVSFLFAGRLIERFGAGLVIAAGATTFAVGTLVWVAGIGLEPHFVGPLLVGAIVTGIGVGLTLPTLMATASSALPPDSFAAGSGVVNMLRQVGLAIGVAILIAILGTPATPDAALDAFRQGWLMIAAASLAAGTAGGVLLRPRRAGSAGAAPHPAAEISPNVPKGAL